MRFLRTTWVGLSLAVAAVAAMQRSVGAIEHAAALRAAVASVTLPELRHHAGLLADDSLEGREAGSRGGRAAARYLENLLKHANLTPAGSSGGYAQQFRGDCQNLLAILPGRDPDLREEYVLVGAHYDHVGYGNRRTSNGPWGYVHNGADDNASGVAALLELIDAANRTGLQPRRSILIAFWDAEEQGLLGSRHWVGQPTVPISQVKLAVNVDMVGRMVDNRLEIVGARTGASLRRLLSSRELPPELRLDFTWELKDNSDHWPLFEAGVPSICLHTGLHGDYHRPSDDLEKLNFEGMQSATAYLVQTVYRLADAPRLAEFRAAARSETPAMQREREKPLDPLPPRLGVAWRKDKDDPNGLLLAARVDAGSPAARAGLQVNDRLHAIDGREVRSVDELATHILRAVDAVELHIVRGVHQHSLRALLHGPPVQLGMAWRDDAAEPGAVYLTRVVPASPASQAGLQVMDRLRALEGEPVEDPDRLLQRIQAALTGGATELVFEIEREGRVSDVSLIVDRQPIGSSDASL